MTTGRLAELQTLLEGVSLPAGRQELIDYARGQGGDRSPAALLEELPERRYRSIDEVAETLQPVQPPQTAHQPPAPSVESDLPPGGDAYTDASAEPGWVRERGPE
jgi:hypothetical protein